MRELRLLWLLFIVLTDAAAVGGRAVKKKNLPKSEAGKSSIPVVCPGDKKGNIDPTHLSQYGEGCMTDSQSLAQFTTLHPSEKGNVAQATSPVASASSTVSPDTSTNTSHSKLENKTTRVKKVKHKTLKVSSDKVHNGGRKGPMSGAQNQGSSVPVSILIPFPIIPVQGQGNAMGGMQPAQQGGGVTAPKKQKKVEKSNSDSNKKYGKRISRKQQGMVNAHLIQLVNRQENASADVPTGNVSIERLKRDTTHIGENTLTDEERTLRDKWLHPAEEDLIPGAENNYYDASDVAFIESSEKNFEKHMFQVWPILRKYKRALFDDHYSEEDLPTKILRQTRGADGRNRKIKLVA